MDGFTILEERIKGRVKTKTWRGPLSFESGGVVCTCAFLGVSRPFRVLLDFELGLLSAVQASPDLPERDQFCVVHSPVTPHYFLGMSTGVRHRG